MLYTQVSEKQEGQRLVRTFRNEKTGTETKVHLIHKDPEGRTWWGFLDLRLIPMMRVSMAQNITNLYRVGMTLKDIQTWCDQEKTLLRSNDPEKYEKLYSLVLEKEKLSSFTADPLRQQLALCSVYIIADDERIDYFDEAQAEAKLKLWAGFPEMVSFFLTWHTDHIRRYMKRLESVSQTVLSLQDQISKMQQDPTAQLKPLEE